MSCSSTTCTSVTYGAPVSKPFTGFEWVRKGPPLWLAKISNSCERSHQRRELLELDNRLLADIGLSREDAFEEACKSFWLDITMRRL